MKIREEDIKRSWVIDGFISINRISGDGRGKVPWTGDISPLKQQLCSPGWTIPAGPAGGRGCTVKESLPMGVQLNEIK